MTIDCVYYNDFIRCFRNGRVERINRQKHKNGWYEVKNKANNSYGYNAFEIDHKKVKRHRLIAFCFLGLDSLIGNKERTNLIDHEDENKLNNAVSNLRIVNHGQNITNRKSIKGCYYYRNRYDARITVNNKQIYLGSFDTEIEARNTYLKAKEKYHKYSPII